MILYINLLPKEEKKNMSKDNFKKQEQIAVFRYGLIASALHMNSKEKNRYLKKK